MPELFNPAAEELTDVGHIVRPEHTAWILTASRVAVVLALVPETLVGLFAGASAIPLVAVLLAGTCYHAATFRTPLGPSNSKGLRIGLIADLIGLVALFYFTGGMLSPLLPFAWIWAMAGTLLLHDYWRWVYAGLLIAGGIVTTPTIHLLYYARFNLNDPGIVISGGTAIAMAAALATYVLYRLHQTRDELVRQTMHDPLTGVLNRRAFDRRIAELCGSGGAARPAFSVSVVDLDHFKRLNDTAGHEAGDRALVTFARLVSTHVRPGDGVYRIGGEEFAVVFPSTSPKEAEAVMHRVRGVVHDATGGTLTFSAGVAGGSDTAVIIEADRAMYAAKRAGRDKVQLSP
jgi:diguanylate cyclase (GGDEF)-like protein